MKEELVSYEQIEELFDSLAETGEYDFSENGLKISAKATEGLFSINITYKPDEAEDFRNYLDTIDDDIFEGVCELMGQDEMSKISNCLESSDLESVRSAIIKFKHYLKEYLNSQINYYRECSARLLK